MALLWDARVDLEAGVELVKHEQQQQQVFFSTSIQSIVFITMCN